MTFGVVASVVLGAVFLLAGAAKIAAGPDWSVQAQALGAPRFSIAVLPWLEVVVGALLCAGVARPVPAIIALAMLVSFSGLLVTRLVQGSHPPCACFGSWSARPLGWRHLVRNAVLIVVAIVALWA